MTLEINVGETSSVTPVISYTPDSIDEYMVIVNLPEDWSVVHNYIINENEIDGIPNRKIDCSNDQSYSLRTSIYMMSAAEAEVLKTHSKVETVELNPHKYPQPQSSDTLRFKKDVAFNKPYITGTSSGSVVYNNGIRANWSMLFASEPSGAPYRGVGIGSTDTVNRDLSFSLTGKGVDAVTIDSGVAAIHPEFLDGNGKSRVKDVILDGPYKVDPDYFVGLGVTYNKVIDGVDIGVGIATTSAEEWWENTSKRSSKFSSLGTVSINSNYTLEQALSKNASSNPILGGHGTACASQIGGKSFGLAIEANLWNIRISLSGNGGVMSGSTAIDVCTVWHNAKKINSTDPDPTILNNSWGSGSECGDSNGTSYNYWYRGSSESYTGNNSNTTIQANIPCCVNKRHRWRGSTTSNFSGTYGGKGEYLPASSTTSSAAENAIAAGVIVLASAGNKNQKISHKDDVDFNNAYSSSTNYINRAGGVQKGFSGDHDKGKGSIRVGALDCAVEPSGEAQGVAKYTPRKVCYSSNGPMIDIWAPGERTMSAGYASYESYQREDDSSFYDYWFGGTSAACPNTVSLVSLYLQSNRSANQDCVRHWLTNHASKEGVISDPYPDVNDSAYWATETFDNPNTYWESYNYRGCGNLRGAPNRALFNPYASDVEYSFTKNESIKALHDRISQSSPPTTWDEAKATWPNAWYDVAFGNGKFVAIAYGESENEGHRIMYTKSPVPVNTDDTSWSKAIAPNAAYWMGITYGNDMFVAVAQGGGTGDRVMYSYDGINWTSASASSTSWWRTVTYGGGKFVALSYQNETTNTATNKVMYSTDGINWTGATGSMEKNWTCIAYGDGRFVAGAIGTGSSDNGGKDFMYSTDGINWTSATTAGSYSQWRGMAYGNGIFVSVSGSGSGGRVAYSTDGGVNWTRSTSIDEEGWWDVTYGNGYFVALAKSGSGNRISYSTDGINWTGTSAAEDNDWSGIAYGNGVFVAVSDDGYSGSPIHRVMYSALDGFTAKPLTFSKPAGNENIIPDNLVLHLDASNNSSYTTGIGTTVWNDTSDKGNDFCFYGSPTYSSENGGVLSFDGTNDYAQGVEEDDLDLRWGESKYSFGAWVKFNSDSVDATFLAASSLFGTNGQYRNGSWEIFYDVSADRVTLHTTRGASNYYWDIENVSYNTWNYIFFSDENDGSTGGDRMYFNGVLQPDAARFTWPGYDFVHNDFFRFATERDGTLCNVTLGSVHVYKGKALNDDEVLFNYNGSKGRYLSDSGNIN